MDPFEMTKEQLIAAIKDPSTQGKRGTLVFCLGKALRDSKEEFDYSDLMPLLVQCIIDGSYEEAQHAVDIMFDSEIDLPIDVSDTLYNQLTEALKVSHSWRGEAIREVLRLFKSEE